jgi:hypothetical protein
VAKEKLAEPVQNGHVSVEEEKTPAEGPESDATEDAGLGADPEAMEVDQQEQKEKESEPDEDGAAMQIEMEMRGPRRNGASPVVERTSPVVQRTSPPPPRRTSGFTAINGRR